MSLDKHVNFNPLVTHEAEINSGVNLKRKVGIKKRQLVDETTFVGIEVEVEGVHTTSGIGKLENAEGNMVGHIWNNVEDNSLRNNGREFVSIPVRGVNIQYALELLESTLKTSVNTKGHEFTDRTSVHVHVNCRDMTAEQLSTFLLVYCLVEPLLYKFTGNTRYNNIFCVPVLETPQAHNIGKAFALGEKNDSKAFSYLMGWTKYNGLNLKPLGNYGTVEFRHMVGTCDSAFLLDWIDIILQMKLYACNNKFTKVKDIILDLNTNSAYVYLLNTIFGTSAQKFYGDNIQEDMEKACCFVKDCFASDVNVKTLSEIVTQTFDENSLLAKHMQSNDLIRKRESNADKYLKEIHSLNQMLQTLADNHPDRKYYQEQLKKCIAAYKKEIARSESPEYKVVPDGNGGFRAEVNW